jgi:hypothetical protein
LTAETTSKVLIDGHGLQERVRAMGFTRSLAAELAARVRGSCSARGFEGLPTVLLKAMSWAFPRWPSTAPTGTLH